MAPWKVGLRVRMHRMRTGVRRKTLSNERTVHQRLPYWDADRKLPDSGQHGYVSPYASEIDNKQNRQKNIIFTAHIYIPVHIDMNENTQEQQYEQYQG